MPKAAVAEGAGRCTMRLWIEKSTWTTRLLRLRATSVLERSGPSRKRLILDGYALPVRRLDVAVTAVVRGAGDVVDIHRGNGVI